MTAGGTVLKMLLDIR